MSMEGIMQKKTVHDVSFNDKRVLMRVDFNVPLDGKTITDIYLQNTIVVINKQGCKFIVSILYVIFIQNWYKMLTFQVNL